MTKRRLMIVAVFGAMVGLAGADVWDELAQFTASDAADSPPVQVEKLIVQTPAAEMGSVEDRLIAVVESTNATQEAKWFSCRMLQRVGTEKCVPVLAGLLGDETMSHYARLTLESMKTSEAAGKALLTSLKAAPDALKIGIMGSLSVRGDKEAVRAIAKYVDSDNIALAKAATEALGRLGGKKAVSVIRKAHAKQAKRSVEPAETLARAKVIRDPGTLCRLQHTGRSPMGEGCVTSEGKPGWKGEYFNGSTCDGDPVLVRCDEEILFDWDMGSPDERIQPDDFTVRWTGTVTPPESRVYTLFADADDQISIAVDGVPLVTISKEGFKREAQVTLEAGTAYAVEVTFGELTGHARIKLAWDCLSGEQQALVACKLATVVPVAQQGSLLTAGDAARESDLHTLMMEGRNPGVRTGAYIQLAAADPKRARNALLESLKKVDDPARPALLRAAMEVGDVLTRDTLIADLQSVPPSDQRVFLAAIEDLELKEYEQEVIALLPNVDGKLRDAVLYTLATIGGPDSFDPLYAAYQANAGAAVTFAISRLPVPSIDAELMRTVAGDADMDKRLAAITPLMLRTPDGAIDLFNRLAGPEQPGALRKAVYKTLESVGDVESCKVFVAAAVQNDAWRRPAQTGLKRLCLSLGKGDDIWRDAFKPGLDSAADDEAREALLAVLDGAACGGSLSYLRAIVKDPNNALRPAAMRSLARWPQFDAGDVWLDVVAVDGSTPEDIAAAQKGIVRVLSRNEIRADSNRKVTLAMKAIQQAPTLEFKLAVLACYDEPSNQEKRSIKRLWKPLLKDTNIVAQVEALLR